MCYSLHVAVNVCINCSFLHLSEVTAVLKRMSKICGIPYPYKSGAQKPPFWTTSQLNGKFNGPYTPNETRYRQSVKCVEMLKCALSLLHRPKMSWTLVHKRLQTGPPFIPTLCKLLESLWNLLQKPHNITHLTLGMLLHYLGIWKIQIFCKYSADIEKMQTNRIFSALILIIVRA